MAVLQRCVECTHLELHTHCWVLCMCCWKWSDKACTLSDSPTCETILYIEILVLLHLHTYSGKSVHVE
jgi:hypothetical protein